MLQSFNNVLHYKPVFLWPANRHERLLLGTGRIPIWRPSKIFTVSFLDYNSGFISDAVSHVRWTFPDREVPDLLPCLDHQKACFVRNCVHLERVRHAGWSRVTPTSASRLRAVFDFLRVFSIRVRDNGFIRVYLVWDSKFAKVCKRNRATSQRR
jgi:hypothetical protein